MLPQANPLAGERRARRQQLRRLDDLLESLEQLNLRDERSIPAKLGELLRQEGIGVGTGTSVSEVMERIWSLQEALLGPAAERPRAAGSAADLDLIFRCYAGCPENNQA